MREERFRATVLGSRGSMSVCREDCAIFGGDTSCYLVEAGEERVFLDAGSGLISAPTDFPGTPLILISHLHLDHLLGLGMYPRLSRKGSRTRILLPAPSREEAVRMLDGVFSRPYWPLSLTAYAGDVQVEPISYPLRIGKLTVEGIEGSHPGGCQVFRLSFGGRSMVYATDFEHEEEASRRLAELARGTDLLLYDGQYTEEEYPTKKGFGHSTASEGLRLQERCGAKRLVLIHHDPQSSDEELMRREAELGSDRACFAREGMVIDI